MILSYSPVLYCPVNIIVIHSVLCNTLYYTMHWTPHSCLLYWWVYCTKQCNVFNVLFFNNVQFNLTLLSFYIIHFKLVTQFVKWQLKDLHSANVLVGLHTVYILQYFKIIVELVKEVNLNIIKFWIFATCLPITGWAICLEN